MLPLTAGSNTVTLQHRVPVPHLSTPVAVTSEREIVFHVEFRLTQHPQSDLVNVQGLQASDFGVTLGGDVILVDGGTVSPLYAAGGLGAGHHTYVM